MLRGNHPQVAHQHWGTIEATEVSNFTDQLHRGHQSNSPESLQNLCRFAKSGQCGSSSDLPLYLPDPRLDEINLRQVAAQTCSSLDSFNSTWLIRTMNFFVECLPNYRSARAHKKDESHAFLIGEDSESIPSDCAPSSALIQIPDQE